MKFICTVLCLFCLTLTIQAQNFTVEHEQSAVFLGFGGNVDPVIGNNGTLSSIVYNDRFWNRLYIYDFATDITDTVIIPGRIITTLDVGAGDDGLGAVYIAYHLKDLDTELLEYPGISIGLLSKDDGTYSFQSRIVDCFSCDDRPEYQLAEAKLKPIYVNNQLLGINYSIMGYHREALGLDTIISSTVYHSNTFNTNLSDEIEKSPYRETVKGNFIGDPALELCGISFDHSQKFTGTQIIDKISSTTIALLHPNGETFASRTTDDGACRNIWAGNFDKTTDYDELLYYGHLEPLDGDGEISFHLALFRFDNGFAERVWLLPVNTFAYWDAFFYWEEKNQIIFLKSNTGIVTRVDAASGEILETIDIGRQIYSSSFFVFPNTNLLGLVAQDDYAKIVVYSFGSPTAIEEPGENLPTAFTLAQNYPNPFNPTTTISFMLEQPGTVELAIYNVTGQKVITLKNSFMTAGEHEVQWNGTDANNNKVASGIYLYKLETNNQSQSRKMLLIK